MEIAGYQVKERLTLEPITLLRAVRIHDQLPVILKVAPKENPDLVSTLQKEYQATLQHAVDGVVHPLGSLSHASAYVIVYRDNGALFLAELLKNSPLSPDLFLQISLPLVALCLRMHEQGIINQQIHPMNILVDNNSGSVSLLGHSGPAVIDSAETDNHSAGPLLYPQYISPEQSGSVGPAIDFRSDFYSLGILFFEMLTGRLPYSAEGQTAWAYVHIATPVPDLADLCPDVPKPICEVVMKLMAKSADERYQSADGILADLTRCTLDYQRNRKVADFSVGERDIPLKIRFPHDIYGRDLELSGLVDIYRRVKSETEIVLISGPAGVGKTSLIDKFREVVIAEGGHFATSKSNPLAKQVPFETILTACRNLVRTVLTLESERLAHYTEQLAEALGRNTEILASSIPELENIFPPLSGELQVGSVEARNRFQLCIHKFLQVLATQEHPLVLFLDDLHWADHSSIALIDTLLAKKLEHFTLIAAYRVDNCADNPPVQGFLSRITERKNRNEYTLSSLSPELTCEFVEQTLKPTDHQVEELARVVFRKTAGNPFHIKSFLSSLFDNGILYFDVQHGWGWDLDKAGKTSAAENVIGLITEKLKTLPALTRWTVAMAAALGRAVSVEDLALICNAKLLEINDHLSKCIQIGILAGTEQGAEFEHDQLRESAYLQIPEDRRAETHLKIGKLLSKRNQSDPESVFNAVGHMNRAQTVIVDPADRLALARLNFKAGQLAKEAFDFITAFTYFKTGLKALGKSGWRECYDLSLSLATESAEAALVSGRFDEIDSLCGSIIGEARDLLDKVPAYEIQIAAKHARRQETDALAQCLSVLRMLGHDVPDSPCEDEVRDSLDRLQEDADAIMSCALEDMPLMPSVQDQFASRLFVKAALMAGFVSERLYYVLTERLVGLIRRAGKSKEFSVAMVMAGGNVCVNSDRHEYGRAIANHGILSGNQELPTPCDLVSHFIMANDVESFFLSPQELGKIYENVQKEAFVQGDLTLACICAYFHSEVAFHSGANLDRLNQLLDNYLEQNRQVGVERIELGLQLLSSLVDKFIGRNEGEGSSDQGAQVEDIVQRAWHANADETVQIISLCHELMYALLTRDRNVLKQVLSRSEGFTAVGLRGVLPFNFYYCLGVLDLHIRSGSGSVEKSMELIGHKHEGLKKRAESSPSSYKHKLDLINALLLQIEGRTAEAVYVFNKAIEGAARNGYVHEEGLACEMAAELHTLIGQNEIAGMYYHRSVMAYRRWGSKLLGERIYQDYGNLFSPLEAAYSSQIQPVTGGGGAGLSEGDIALKRVDRAKRALSHELDLSRLVEVFISSLLENTGAQKAALLVDHSGTLYLESLGMVGKEVALFEGRQLQDCPDICQSVIRYVSRSHDSVIIGNAAEDVQFGNDPYIKSSNVRSILCAPVMHQTAPVAYLYLENSTIPDLFSEERQSIVRTLSAETAVALQNARLTERLKVENRLRKEKEADLKAALEELSQVKKGIEAENIYLQEEIKSTHNFEEIVGESKPLKQVLNKIELVAPTDANVLILGETGTGKELVARAIHNRSQRKNRPLVKVNCAALPSTLIESELFGHEKGAFTGALERKIGRFELANGGTIFLDEIGDLPLELQAKLLRVLQEGEFERLGTSKTVKVDVRVIAATNRNLEEESAKGSFRSDLFYRLSVFPIESPALRMRVGDIPILVHFFIAKYNKQLGKNIEVVSAETMSALENYSWPGNIRELQNVIERGMILSNAEFLNIDPSFQGLSGEVSLNALGDNSLDEAERNHILKILDRCSWKISGQGNAAEQLGLKPSTLRFRMGKLGIKRPS